MKYYNRLLILFTLLAGRAQAQPDYPTAPPPPSNIIRLEYFIDNDPGMGNGMAVPVTPGSNISNLPVAVNVNGLAAGFHRFFIRSLNAQGIWSLTNQAFFDNFTVPVYPTPVAAANITELEYFIDTDPGMGNGIKLPVTPATNLPAQSYNVNVTGLTAGLHRLFIRSKNVQGIWSITNFSVFDNSAVLPYPTAPAAAGNISRLEYYIDTDPGFGNGTAVTIPATANISNLSVNVAVGGLPQGTHHLYVRSKENPWSMSTVATFTIGAALPVSWLYVRGSIVNEGALIEWSTAQESNTDKFVVEYSIDGAAYTPAGELKAAGFSSVPQKYQLLHKSVQTGFNYYRIRQVDKDGRFTYSRIITLLQQNGLSKATLSPNPASDLVHIAMPAPADIRQVQVHDRQGKLVWQQTYNLQGVKALSIPVSQLPAGTYVLAVHTGAAAHSNYRFVKL
jgi:hypothetical protein